MRQELTAKDKELEQQKESLQSNSNAQVAELEKCVVKMTEQRAKDKKEIETLKAAKKDQSLKMAKQAKENLMKQKELEGQLKESAQAISNLESQLQLSNQTGESQTVDLRNQLNQAQNTL